MEPTYKDGGFNFCFKQRYFFSEPKKGDVVTVRLAGEKVMLLKRIIAVEGDTLAFEDGKLYLNEEQVDEAYVKYPSDWDLPKKVLKKAMSMWWGTTEAYRCIHTVLDKHL